MSVLGQALGQGGRYSQTTLRVTIYVEFESS